MHHCKCLYRIINRFNFKKILILTLKFLKQFKVSSRLIQKLILSPSLCEKGFQWKSFSLLAGSLLFDEKSAKVLQKSPSQPFWVALTPPFNMVHAFFGDRFGGIEGGLRTYKPSSQELRYIFALSGLGF
jgi:hypothetical protein